MVIKPVILDSQLNAFIKKLELQALETAEERLPLYLKVGLKDPTALKSATDADNFKD